MPPKRHNMRMMCMRLPDHMKARIKEIAERKGIAYQALIRHYIDLGITQDTLLNAGEVYLIGEPKFVGKFPPAPERRVARTP